MFTPVFLFVRRHESWKDKLVRASRASSAGHCGVQVGPDRVIDITLRHGCHAWTLAEWNAMWRHVTAVAVEPRSDGNYTDAINFLESQVGVAAYDLPEWLGFISWRDAGDRDMFVCSSLCLRALQLLTGVEFPDDRGRQDPRIALWAVYYYAVGYKAGRLHTFFEGH